MDQYGYSKEHIARLLKSGKLEGKQWGAKGNWYISAADLAEYHARMRNDRIVEPITIFHCSPKAKEQIEGINKVIIYGGTGQAKVVRPIIEYYKDAVGAAAPQVVLVVNDNPDAVPPYPDVPMVCGQDGLAQWLAGQDIDKSEYGFVVAIGNPNGGARVRIANYMKSLGFKPFSVIHPCSVIAKNARLGEGIQVMAGAIIQDEAVIGDQCLINTNSSVDHECILGDGVEIGPRAVVCGSVTIKDRAWVAAGATVLPWLTLEEDAIAGAGSVVTKSIPRNEVWVGVPAKYMRLAVKPPSPPTK